MNLLIQNIPLEMWAHLVNGFAGRGDAYSTMTVEEQSALVSSRLVAYAATVARSHAISAAQIAVTQQVGALADALIAATEAAIQISVEQSAGEGGTQ